MARDVLIPDPLSSDQQYTRFYHLDLPELEDTELTDELYALRPLLWGLPPEHWLRERVKALEAEMIKHRGNTSQFRARTKPELAKGVKL